MRKKMEKLFKVTCNPQVPKILAIGKNYVKHVQEMGGDKPPKEPVIFSKPHSSLYTCFEDKAYSFKLPRHGREIHHEIELGFMISRDIKRYCYDPEWQKYIGGYFLCLDLTDRDLQAHMKREGFPWELAKGQVHIYLYIYIILTLQKDQFLPISDLVHVQDVVDPHKLDLQLQINDKIVQIDSTESMYYKINQILEYISQHMTLNVGDLILTGTPHGVGPIREGDKLRGLLSQEGKQIAQLQLEIEKS